MISSGHTGYWKNGFNMFYDDRLIQGASFVHFKDLGEGWAKDMHKVYYIGEIVYDAEPFFFKILGNGYAKDNHHVYRYGQVMPDVDPFFFQVPPNTSYYSPISLPTTVITHHHDPSSITSCTSMQPAYIQPVEIHPTVYIPPSTPIPLGTNQISTHVTIPSRQIGGHVIGTCDTVDCCILI